MQSRIFELLLFYPVFLFSLSVHEAAHAWVANHFGDSTAKDLGRITVNPLPHMDIVGTAFLPILGILTGAPVIGWGKPVPVDPRNLQNERKDHLWIAAAGPISNIVLALGFTAFAWGLLYALPHFSEANLTQGTMTYTTISGLLAITKMGVILNLVLACFNLLPLFPLDGSAIVRGLLPERHVPLFESFSRFGMWILLGLFITGLLKYLLFPVFLVSGFLLPF